jgi:predicted RND superfamily exporter protein
MSDTMKRLNRSMHGDAPSEYKLPARHDLAAWYLLLYEMSQPYGLDLNNQVNVDRSATRLVAMVGDLSAKELREVDSPAQRWLRENAPPVMASSGASPGLMFAHLSERNIEEMIRGTAGAFSISTLVLVAALGSRRVGLLSLVPNAAPTLLAFGIWVVTVGYAGMSVSVVSACSRGIIVDGTVHFLNKYLRARRELALSAEAAVPYAIVTVGAACGSLSRSSSQASSFCRGPPLRPTFSSVC